MKTPFQKTLSEGMRPSTLFQVGLIFALGITLIGFEFESTETRIHKVVAKKTKAVEKEIIYEDFEVERPRVPLQSGLSGGHGPNIQNPTVQQHLISTNIVTTTNEQEVTTQIGFPSSDTVAVVVTFVDTREPEKPVVSEIFDIVEEMPTYETLLSIKDKSLRKIETEKEMLNYIYQTIKYPEMARQTGIQGKVYVQFIVNVRGEISDVKIVRGVHQELDAEAIRAVQSLPKMLPGKQLDRAVNVRFTIPIEFKLKN